MNSEKKAYFEMIVWNKEEIGTGHFFIYKSIEETDYKKGGNR